jgi:hypothetical protein
VERLRPAAVDPDRAALGTHDVAHLVEHLVSAVDEIERGAERFADRVEKVDLFEALREFGGELAEFPAGLSGERQHGREGLRQVLRGHGSGRLDLQLEPVGLIRLPGGHLTDARALERLPIEAGGRV